MENTTTEKKELFDADHGFIMMQKWPEFLRWLLILPVSLLAFIFVNGISNWALKISTADWFLYTVSFIFHTLASALFIYYGAATAPTARKIVMIILALILFVVSILIFFIPQENYEDRDLSPTLKIINIVSTILGIALAFFWKKGKPEVN